MIKPFLVTVQFCATLLSITTIGGFAQAQDQRKHLTLSGIPSALVAPNRTLFAGIGIASKRSATSSNPDGSAAIGYSFGSAENSVGLQLTANITSLENDFADSGYLSFKASRRIVDGRAPVYASLGFGYLGAWGDSKTRKETAILAFTRFSELQIGQDRFPIMMTLGAGSDLRNNNTDPGVFFGMGMGVSKNVAISAAYTGETVTLGTGFKLDAAPNVSFGLSLDDAFNDQNKRRLIFTVGMTFTNPFGG